MRLSGRRVVFARSTGRKNLVVVWANNEAPASRRGYLLGFLFSRREKKPQALVALKRKSRIRLPPFQALPASQASPVFSPGSLPCRTCPPFRAVHPLAGDRTSSPPGSRFRGAADHRSERDHCCDRLSIFSGTPPVAFGPRQGLDARVRGWFRKKGR